MRVLIVPVGINHNRVLKAIAHYKPDKIYLCVAKEGTWNTMTRRAAEKVKKQIGLFYDSKFTAKKAVETFYVNMRDYIEVYKGLFRLATTLTLTKPEGEDVEILIDTTSTTRIFVMAALILSIFMPNVRCSYTPAKNPLLPDEYPAKSREDVGLEPVMIPTPRIDFSEIREGEMRNILITMKEKFGGNVRGLTHMLEYLKMTPDRANMIKISKLVKKLENYGCVQTRKIGRETEARLTPLGDSIAEVLS